MRNRILLGLAAILLSLPIACSTGLSPFWTSIVMADSESGSSSNIMIVFYTIADEMYLFWTDLDAVITDNGDDTWDVISDQVTASGVNQATVTYGYYQYQEIVPTEFDENGEPLPIDMAGLNLQPPTSDDLPKSQHIGVLTAVDPALTRPATVTRKWHGVLYDVQCLVDQDIVDMYQAGDLNIGDYVIVSFIDEIPNTTEINIAIITGKVYESWP